MDQFPYNGDGHVKVMAAIGGVCVQWALLEHLVLGLIGTIETMHLHKVYLVFGSLDMKPRLDMAILLATEAKVPVAYVKRIRAVRTALKDERLTDRRNQAVHGVHAAAEDPDSVQLTMPRWSEPRRTETVSGIELVMLANRLGELGHEITAIGEEIFNWKIRVLENRKKHMEREFATTNNPIIPKIAKRLYARVRDRWRKG